jgi:hypothetical protein
MTKLNGFWSDNILICFIYIYNNKKNLLFFIFLVIFGGGGEVVLILFVCYFLFFFWLFYQFEGTVRFASYLDLHLDSESLLKTKLYGKGEDLNFAL